MTDHQKDFFKRIIAEFKKREGIPVITGFTCLGHGTGAEWYMQGRLAPGVFMNPLDDRQSPAIEQKPQLEYVVLDKDESRKRPEAGDQVAPCMKRFILGQRVRFAFYETATGKTLRGQGFIDSIGDELDPRSMFIIRVSNSGDLKVGGRYYFGEEHLTDAGH